MIDWPGGSWQDTVRIILLVLGTYGAVIWVALIFWVFRDIRQRTRDPVMQLISVLLALAFFLPGHWVYLILRPRQTLTELYERSIEEEAILQDLDDQKACPACRRRVRDDFLVCPACLTALKESSTGCGKPLDYGWPACPYCAREKMPSTAPGPIDNHVEIRSDPGRNAPGLAAGLVRRSTSLVRRRSPDR